MNPNSSTDLAPISALFLQHPLLMPQITSVIMMYRWPSPNYSRTVLTHDIEWLGSSACIIITQS